MPLDCLVHNETSQLYQRLNNLWPYINAMLEQLNVPAEVRKNFKTNLSAHAKNPHLPIYAFLHGWDQAPTSFTMAASKYPTFILRHADTNKVEVTISITQPTLDTVPEFYLALKSSAKGLHSQVQVELPFLTSSNRDAESQQRFLNVLTGTEISSTARTFCHLLMHEHLHQAIVSYHNKQQNTQQAANAA